MERGQLVRQLPAVHELIRACGLEKEYPSRLITAVSRDVLSRWRRGILEEGAVPPDLEALAEEVRKAVKERYIPKLRPVINATGVVLHTNMGRAPLSESAQEALLSVARGYCNLEIDLKTGLRGSRYEHVEEVLTFLTGAEAALVVNNNAAAVLLLLQALARGKEVIVSRGELIEIGGSFRIPDIMAQSGALLREVGTTNKTYPQDYERAISQDTALILKVHPSNYRVLGFSREVSRSELVALGRKHNIPVAEDLGSGVFVDLRQYGVGSEPTVQESLAEGVDVVTFSGDKLLGGPQAGIIVGRSQILDILKKHPLLRALRVDKLVLAALEATLREYLKEHPEAFLPVLRMLTIPHSRLRERAAAFKEKIAGFLGDRCVLVLKDGVSPVGGGALPLTELPASLVVIYPKDVGASEIAARLRMGKPPVLVRVQDEGILIDLRTVLDEDDDILAKAVESAFVKEERTT